MTTVVLLSAVTCCQLLSDFQLLKVVTRLVRCKVGAASLEVLLRVSICHLDDSNVNNLSSDIIA
jgi:hypothetical protein